MGLKDELQAEIAEAFDEDLADAVHAFTCERIVSTSWNPKTNTSEKIVDQYNGRGVLFGSYSQYEIQKLGVLATDKKATVLQNEVSLTPKIDDEWLTALGSFNRIQPLLFGNVS